MVGAGVESRSPGRLRIRPSGVQVASAELERLAVGELHLVRRRLDETLDRVAAVLRTCERVEEWEDVERAARIAFRALTYAVSAVPPQPQGPPIPEVLEVGPLRIDTCVGRQWWGPEEFELSPLLHRLLVCLAGEPNRCFSGTDLLREVWEPLSRSQTRLSAVRATVMRLRRVLAQVGAPAGEYVVTQRGCGWALRAKQPR